MSPIIPAELRDKHIYLAGKTGHGKSTTIIHQVLQDIGSGLGVCVIDPTADMVNKLIHHVPPHRAEDCIWFDTSSPIPIDWFSYHDPKEREILTDELVSIFKLENAPKAMPLLKRLIGTLFDANENPRIPPDRRATFLDISEFMENPARQKEILSYTPHRKIQWEHLQAKDFEAVLYRMIPFHEYPTLRTIFGSPTASLNIWDVMQQSKILLVKLEQTAPSPKLAQRRFTMAKDAVSTLASASAGNADRRIRFAFLKRSSTNRRSNSNSSQLSASLWYRLRCFKCPRPGIRKTTAYLTDRIPRSVRQIQWLQLGIQLRHYS